MNIDHRHEAGEWLQASSVWESPDARSVPMMLAALTHAVLALTDATEASRAGNTLAHVEALCAEWEAAAQKPMPERAPAESAQDQGVRIGVWHTVKTAAAELRAAVTAARTHPGEPTA